MRIKSIRSTLTMGALVLAVASPLALSHFDDQAIPQSYRQSYFALLANNFGPIVAMVKGDIPWDEAALQGYANDLATVTDLNLMRGFPPGSDTGQTRAKPEIWENMDDFNAKNEDLKTAAKALQSAASGGDKNAVVGAFKQTAAACKACHDEYKAENYLN